ncbi:MAG: HAD family phosphatase [archaeon]
MAHPYFSDHTLEKLIDDSEAVIFDMNGLIFDDEPIHFGIFNQIIEQYGVKIGEDEYIKDYLGHKPSAVLQIIKEKYNLHYDSESLSVQFYEKRVESISKILDRVRPGVIEFFDYLITQGKKVALVTSATEEMATIVLGNSGIGILDKFTTYVCSDMVQGDKKSAYEMAVAKLGVDSKKCIALEDSAHGVNSAASAGIRCIAVPNQYTINQNFSSATYVIGSLERTLNLE